MMHSQAIPLHGHLAAQPVRSAIRVITALVIIATGPGIFAATAPARTPAPTLPPSSPAPIAMAIDWSRPTGAHATGLSYGLNAYGGFDPVTAGIPGLPAYHAGLAHMAPGILRYHRADETADAATHPSGWMIDPGKVDFHWDRNRISRALAGLDAAAWHPTIMIDVVNWPGILADPRSGKLRPDRLEAYATCCADLVRIINVELHHHLRYWEITNEVDGLYGDDPDGLAAIYLQAARAMKAVDPSIATGGPAFARPDIGRHVDDFITRTHRSLDFISYHAYATGDRSLPDARIWDTAAGLGWITSDIRARFHRVDPRPIALFQDEYNISWNPPDVRQTNAVGAVFDALAMASLVHARVTGAMAWNDADGWYGKLDAAMVMRPAAHVFALFNRCLIGAEATTTSARPQAVVVFAVSTPGHHGIALIVRSHRAQSVRLTMQGLTSATATWTQATVTGSGVTLVHPSLAAQGPWSMELPAVSVTVLRDGPIIDP